MIEILLFVLFWWGLLMTIFAFQLNKENTLYRKKLGIESWNKETLNIVQKTKLIVTNAWIKISAIQLRIQTKKLIQQYIWLR